MSAVQLPRSASSPDLPERARPQLRAVRLQPARLGRLPFVILVATILAVGMVGVLVLNITIQSQASELRSLQTKATELDYQEAALQSQVDRLRSPSNIAARAAQLGMRPNPNPAFITLPSGKIVGTPTPVTGQALSPLVAVPAPPKPEAQEPTDQQPQDPQPATTGEGR